MPLPVATSVYMELSKGYMYPRESYSDRQTHLLTLHLHHYILYVDAHADGSIHCKMAESESPTSWPLPPTSTSPFLLKQQLRTLRHDIAELTASTKTAADRIAVVLKRLRSQDERRMHTFADVDSHGSDLSATMRDHPFARFSFHDTAHFESSPPIETPTESKGEPTLSSKLGVVIL